MCLFYFTKSSREPSNHYCENGALFCNHVSDGYFEKLYLLKSSLGAISGAYFNRLRNLLGEASKLVAAERN
jgi:hypothetical protein